MKSPFEIEFDFPLAHSDLIVSLGATVHIHHSEIYYVVNNFHFAGAEPKENEVSMIPEQEIKSTHRDGSTVWVHRESERESQLSIAIVKAIEKYLSKENDRTIGTP